MRTKIQKITPNLWFNSQAEEAAKFYTSIFKNSKIGRTIYYGKGSHDVHRALEGTAMTVEFQLDGQEFVALNGGPQFNFTEAISFIVHCDDQEELDYYWEKLSEGGDERAQVCGWLKDKFGVSWQIVPSTLTDMISDPDPNKSERVMKALLQTKTKIDLKALQEAYEGKALTS
ncbi:VOC family protein [Paenibacillus sp. DMB20]|uniref:VOC family protein n=1 Tax=Paenibacillus sp. DMB20 TaxID=1642570 RepID=UPI000627BCC1|nr:VOC family protein [Paenibacillus sp. DMB20]KKO53223.1 3-demethylubiquinone-9 3-methyltransferase [Paenibacillus sp. DMB20]